MKKIYTLLAATVAALTTVSAQQLPNAGFEDGWGACTPWTSNNYKNPTGTTPGSWTISQVSGVSTGKTMLGQGATVVGEKVAGYNSTAAVSVYNSPNSVMTSVNVPGYVTLGTTWSTSAMNKNNDGGTFGGINFTYQPDALSFMYQHPDASSEGSTILLYSWKGQWSQANVPGNIVPITGPTKCTMIDRDRNILGKSTPQGGTVTKSSDAELISTLEATISGSFSEWTKFEQEIEYKSNSTPEKINLIFSAGDYWNATPKSGPKLNIDDVKLIYYSRLSSLKVNGAEVPAFAPETYNYDLSAIQMPDDASALSYVVKGRTAKANVALDNDKNQVLITVSNDGEDADGKKEHVYTLQFGPKVVAATSISLDKTELTLKPNETATLTATVLPENATDKTVTWETDNELAATVENGVVTALNEGTATITAKCGNLSATCVVTVKGEEKPEYPAGASVFKGTLVINMDGGQLNEGDVTQYELIIAPQGNGLYTLSLPNFALDGEPLGDIVIENVACSGNADNTVYTYKGHKSDLELADGAIVADVDCEGTETRAGALNMTINVGWKMDEETTIPIEVLFNGTRIITGVDAIESDSNDAPVEYYNLQGIRVDNPAAGQILIRRQGSTVTKIIL